MDQIDGAPPGARSKEQTEDLLRSMGLDVEHIRQHQANVAVFLNSLVPTFFPILDTCRLDNGGILRLPSRRSEVAINIPMVAFIPAAGASSRYLDVFTPLLRAIKEADPKGVREVISDLETKGLSDCPLPASVGELFAAVKSPTGVVPDSLWNKVLSDIELPKALYPAVIEGDTFLEVKLREHRAIGGFAGEVYVCPPGRSEGFKKIADEKQAPWGMYCFEQGPSLATVRFNASADIALTDHGAPSSVPAGHGALLQLLPKVSEEIPGTRGVLIRNIDNVSGIRSEIIETTQRFIEAFRFTLTKMDGIRKALQNRNEEVSFSEAQDLISFWGLEKNVDQDLIETILEKLFHTASGALIDQIHDLMARPLVIMGQVPNTGSDVGGTCVFTEIQGIRQKLCLEVPHASPRDRAQFLENPSKATHFNPVFVAAEIPTKKYLSQWAGHPFWSVVKKSWRGQDVYYQESILYEMLGSSQYCNVIYVEIPRILFNPHKTMKDASKRSRAFWHFEDPKSNPQT